MPWPLRLKRNVRLALEKHLPAVARWARRDGESVPFYGMTKAELAAVLGASRFSEDFSVTRQVCRSPLWEGVHLECAASKPRLKRGPQAG